MNKKTSDLSNYKTGYNFMLNNFYIKRLFFKHELERVKVYNKIPFFDLLLTLIVLIFDFRVMIPNI